MTDEKVFYKKTGCFPLLFLHRGDIQRTFPTLRSLSDDEFESVVDLMSDAILECGCFWIALKDATKQIMMIQD